MSLEAINVSKRFGAHHALRDVTLRVADGELIVLLGPSGGGKTTLLRILAGLEVPDTGTVKLGDQEVTRTGPSSRGVGFVFQHYALFREMSVFENIAFGLRVKPRKERLAEVAIRERVRELLELVQLETLAGRFPDQLSGGQRQRVALARALAVQPKILLLDEPFGALDAKVRRELRGWLRRLHDEPALLSRTIVLVTHDQEEAIEIADRVVVIHQGEVHQEGPPAELLLRPANPFVSEFLGEQQLVPARVEEDGRVQLDAIEIPGAKAGSQVHVALRGLRLIGGSP